MNPKNPNSDNRQCAPPKFAQRFLLWFLRDDFSEEVQGDLEEQFEDLLKRMSPFRAKMNYWYQVFNYMRPFAIGKSTYSNTNHIAMFRHNFLISFRNFRRHKISFFINMVGLSTGLACAIFIYLWVSDELSVDKFNKKDNRLYEVMENIEVPGGIQTGSGTPGILASALANEIPEVEYATSVVPTDWFSEKGVLTFDEKRIRAKAQYVDESYFNVFSCDFIKGDKQHALSDKSSIAISDKLATKLFNTTENIIGKVVEWKMGQSTGLFKIAGVFKRPPANATDQYDLLVNYEVFLDAHPWLKEWGNSDPSTFVILTEGADVKQVNEKIHNFVKSRSKESHQTLFLQRYSDRYLYGRYENGAPTGGRIEYVKLFSVIAILVLVIACINFMNLSTARASRRLKEVGIKKAIGANRKALIFQYFEESMLMTILSMVTAVLIVFLLLPKFNTLTGKQLEFSTELILPLLGITILTGIIAGSYPALYHSGFRPAEVLKGKVSGSVGEFWARKGLVIFQFTISVVIIVFVVVIYKQIDFVQSKNLGYNRDNILHFNLEIPDNSDPNFLAVGGKFEQSVETFLEKVNRIPGVVNAANFDHDLTGNHGVLGGVDWEAGDQDEQNMFSNLEVGYDFIKTFDIKMAAGRNFSRNFADDRSAIIFNEVAIRLMRLKDPIGKTIRLWGKEKHIIGVTKNFNFESLYQEVTPCLFQLEPRSPRVLVKIRQGTEKETIASLKQLYQEQYPGLAFDYRFVDDDYQALYASEMRVSAISQYFSEIAILISSLGLFGLAAFTAERRTKEIGIRKILGAGDFSIIRLLSEDFTKMVLVAIFIALPIGYFVAAKWLQVFAYRIDLKWWYFAGAGCMALLIAWFTVGMQTVKAARVNPVECLKDE